MAFRPISEVLAGVMADLREGMDATGDGAAGEPALHPARHGNLAAAMQGGQTAAARGREPRDHATRGGDPSAMGMGKKAGANPRQLEGREVSQTKARNETALHAYGAHMRPALHCVSSKCLPRQPHTAPHRGLGKHLVLVSGAGHSAAS